MNPARIAELLDPFLSVSAPVAGPGHSNNAFPDQGRVGPAVPAPDNSERLSTVDLEHISTYIDLLLRWNSRINLTAIRNPEEIVTRHFGESLFAARHLFPRTLPAASPGALPAALPGTLPATLPGTLPAASARGRAALQGRVTCRQKTGALAPDGSSRPTTPARVADLGSGAGFPGIPFKLWAPHISLTLIESNHKKATFLREITRALTLTDVNIQNTRIESASRTTLDSPTSDTTTFDVVTLRAVERFETILPVAASLVGLAGRLALLIGSSQLDMLDAACLSSAFAWSTPIPIPLSRSRVLVMAVSSAP